MAYDANAYWGREGLEGQILAALTTVGRDPGALTVDDLAPADQFHSGGKPSTVRLAGELARLAAAGLDGLAINFVDYLKELSYFAAEVLPRLEKLGLRSRTPLLH